MTGEEGYDSRQLAHNIFGSTGLPPEDYVNSLEAFIQHCDISQALQQARATINEEDYPQTNRHYSTKNNPRLPEDLAKNSARNSFPRSL